MPDWIDFSPETPTPEEILSLEQDLDAIANSFDAPYNGEIVLLINSYLPLLLQNPEDWMDLMNEQFGTDFEDIEDALCQTVEKTWLPVEEPRRNLRPPNIGAGLSGLFQGQPTPLPTASAPAPNSPGTPIRPPSTGDAALKAFTD